MSLLSCYLMVQLLIVVVVMVVILCVVLLIVIGVYFGFVRDMVMLDGVDGLRPEVLAKLEAAFEIAGTPFRVTSAFRSEGNNAIVGGVPQSAHLRGFAVDLAVANSRSRFLLLRALFEVGFCRIGVYKDHVHVDCDLTLDQDVLWL